MDKVNEKPPETLVAVFSDPGSAEEVILKLTQVSLLHQLIERTRF